MKSIVAPDPAAAARAAADLLVRVCREAIAVRGHAVLAVSGGETPWLMLRELVQADLPWSSVHVAQVDERIAPRGDAIRNLTRLQSILVADGPLPAANLLAMPVEEADAEAAARHYASTLGRYCGSPLVLDLVQLGLGTDGHTASLVPADPVLGVHDRDVALSLPYQGRPRLTLTYPALNRARHRLWLVTGEAKAARLAELMAGTGDTPAVRVSQSGSVVVADAAAARDMPAGSHR